MLAFAAVSFSQTQANGAKPEDTEVWSPVPPKVTPGDKCGAPPSDAIVLFDGKNLDEWVSAQDQSPAKWTVADGVLTVNKSRGQHRDQTQIQGLSTSHRMEDSGRYFGLRAGARQ